MGTFEGDHHFHPGSQPTVRATYGCGRTPGEANGGTHGERLAGLGFLYRDAVPLRGHDREALGSNPSDLLARHRPDRCRRGRSSLSASVLGPLGRLWWRAPSRHVQLPGGLPWHLQSDRAPPSAGSRHLHARGLRVQPALWWESAPGSAGAGTDLSYATSVPHRRYVPERLGHAQ